MSSATSPSSPRRSLPSQAGAWLREQILTGAIPAEAVLRPDEVGKTLKISQTPVREAMQVLRIEGFLRIEPGVGFVVEPLTATDIRDIFVAHALLAGEVAARAVANSSDRDVEELEALHFELLAATRRKRWEIVEDRNHEFHRYISRLADSPKLSHILGIVARYVPRSFYASVNGWAAASADDHLQIISAFKNQDVERARETMSTHMANAGNLLAEHYFSDQ